MTVAEVPGQPRERRGIVDAHLKERLGFRDNFHEAAVVKQQRVVGAQPHRLGEVELDAGAFHAKEKSALRLALRKRQDKRVDHLAGLAVG